MIDSQDVVFPRVPRSVWPLDEYGAWKGTSGYNYETVKERYCSDRLTISSVQASKVGDGVRLDDGIFLGLIDVVVDKVRTIH